MTPQDKVSAWMESQGFKHDSLSPYGWLLPGSTPQMSVDNDAAAFFHAAQEKAVLEARIDELETAQEVFKARHGGNMWSYIHNRIAELRAQLTKLEKEQAG
jgi:S-formylglutathione hydrolase FrmB